MVGATAKACGARVGHDGGAKAPCGFRQGLGQALGVDELLVRRKVAGDDARAEVGLFLQQRGVVQPFIAGDWNPQGYGANPYHRIAVRLGA